MLLLEEVRNFSMLFPSVRFVWWWSRHPHHKKGCIRQMLCWWMVFVGCLVVCFGCLLCLLVSMPMNEVRNFTLTCLPRLLNSLSQSFLRSMALCQCATMHHAFHPASIVPYYSSTEEGSHSYMWHTIKYLMWCIHLQVWHQNRTFLPSYLF